jgi:transcriptional antiterminator NusG
MNETPIEHSNQAAPEQTAEPAVSGPDDDATTEELVEDAVTAAVVEEAVSDAIIEEAVEETLSQAVADAIAVEAVSDAAIQEAYEERVVEAVESGVEGDQLADAIAQAAADADVQEAIADGAIAQALEETIIEVVQEATLIEAEADASIAQDLEERIEAIADEAVAEAEPEPEPIADEAVAEADAEPEPSPEPAAEELDGEVPEAGRDPFRGPGDWYVVHTYAGYENKVKTNLESRIHTMQMEDKIFDVHIPMEDVMEIKGGKKQVVQRKVFPGYLLVKMIYDNDSWYVVRNTPGVTGFVAAGTGSKPTPLSKREVEKILVVKKEEVKPQFRLGFEEGDVVRIIAGPFADFNGTISEINLDQSKLKVLVNIFDRETPVELSFDQVAKV